MVKPIVDFKGDINNIIKERLELKKNFINNSESFSLAPVEIAEQLQARAISKATNPMAKISIFQSMHNKLESVKRDQRIHDINYCSKRAGI